MLPNLSSTLPAAILGAVEKALAMGDRILNNQSVALSARAAHFELARKTRQLDTDNVTGQMARSIFSWGLAVREQLPLDKLHERFNVLGDEPGPYLSVINDHVDLPAEGGAPGGRLGTDLRLSLYSMALRPFQCIERFDGYLMRSPSDTFITSAEELGDRLHPRIIRAIFSRIADGAIWTRVEHGMGKLKVWCKDG